MFKREFEIGLALTFDLAESLVGESVKEETERVRKEINKINELTQSKNNNETILRQDREHSTLCKTR